MGHSGSDCAAFWRLVSVESAAASIKMRAMKKGAKGRRLMVGAPLAPNPLIENETLK
jgi:hypothetical protein